MHTVELLRFVMHKKHCSPRMAVANCKQCIVYFVCALEPVINLNLKHNSQNKATQDEDDNLLLFLHLFQKVVECFKSLSLTCL